MAATPGLIVADAPGLGKTIETVMACDLIEAKSILVFCPSTVKNHCAETFREWGSIDREVDVAEGVPKFIRRNTVSIGSHACLVKEQAALMYALAGPYDAVIVDEAHELRQFRAARTRNMFGPMNYALWRQTKYVWSLTGTPIVASAHDLYPWHASVLANRMPEQFSDYQFRDRFTHVREDARGNLKSKGVKRLDEIVNLFGPFVMRRTLDSLGINLPPLTIQNLHVPLDHGTVEPILAALTGWTPEKLENVGADGGAEEDSVLASVRHALGLAKVNYAKNRILDLIRSGIYPIVAFFHHTAVRKALGEALNGMGVDFNYIDGSVSPRRVAQAQADFQSGKTPVLLVQTQAGGMGLTLTASNYALIVEPPWTAMALEQMVKRIHRITQLRPCLAEIMLADDVFVDPIMANVTAHKAETAAKILMPFTRNF